MNLKRLFWWKRKGDRAGNSPLSYGYADFVRRYVDGDDR